MKGEKKMKTDDKKLVEPLMQYPIIAFFLAIAAGAFDGYAYFTTQTFSTFQSGNIILFGYTLATDDMTKFFPVVISILAFALGAIATAIIRDALTKRGKIWTFIILAFEVVALIAIIATIEFKVFDAHQVVWLLAFLAGMQGNAFHKIGGMLYGNIAVTLNVQLAANYLAETFFKSNKEKRAVMFNKFFNYFIVLVGFGGGAYLSATLASTLGGYTLLIAILALIGIYVAGRVLHKQNSDLPIDSN